MERLTDKKVGCSYPLKDKASSKVGLFTDYDGFYAYFEGVNRLGEIEDILGDEYSLEKLKEMVDAEKDGRITILPFKIPEKIYQIKNKKIKAYNVLEIAINGNKIIFRTEVKRCFIGFRYTFVVEKNDVGETVFLTREEAEKALEGMEV